MGSRLTRKADPGTSQQLHQGGGIIAILWMGRLRSQGQESRALRFVTQLVAELHVLAPDSVPGCVPGEMDRGALSGPFFLYPD